ARPDDRGEPDGLPAAVGARDPRGRHRRARDAVAAHGVRPEGLWRVGLPRRAGRDRERRQRRAPAARHHGQQPADEGRAPRRPDRGGPGEEMTIDSHAHLVPPDLIAAIRTERARFPNVRVIEEGGSIALAFAGGKPTRPVSKPLSDIAARLAWMDKQNISHQVCGGWVDSFGYELPAAEGEAWARLINDALLTTAKAQPRFVPLATVPLQDGARAAAVLKEAVAAGAPGVMIGTLPRG